MAARFATAVKSPQKAQRELEDLQLVLKARNGSSAALDQLIRRYKSFVRPEGSPYLLPPLPVGPRAEGELVLPRGRRLGGPDPGGARRPLQGGARLPAGQGDVVP